VSEYSSNPGLEFGLQFVQQTEWLPPRCDPTYVQSALAAGTGDACRGRLVGERRVTSNVVERLAIAWGLLRVHGLEDNQRVLMWETLEALGNEVSPEVAEMGLEAYDVFRIAGTLQRGDRVDAIERERATRGLGQLWASAFTAPPGFERHIARSAARQVPNHLNFFDAVPEGQIPDREEGTYFARLVDLLQAAVALKDLPDSTVGATLKLGNWTNLVGHIPSGRGSHKPKPLAMHAQRIPLGAHSSQIALRLEDTATGETICSGRATVLEGATGMFDEFVDIASEPGGLVEATVRAAFVPSDVVTIYPRVRRVLDRAENLIHKLVILDGLYVVPGWRSRSLGIRLLRQLLVECEYPDLVLGRTGPYQPRGMQDSMAFGVQAGYAAARLRLARYWHEMGAEYLFNGVMGMSISVIEAICQRGEQERLGR